MRSLMSSHGSNCDPGVVGPDAEYTQAGAEEGVTGPQSSGSAAATALSRIAHLIRWTDWGPGKVPVLFVVLFHIGLSERERSPFLPLDVVLFIAYASVHSALGYVVNDWGDRELDLLHGKPNVFASMTDRRGRVVLVSLMLLAFATGLPFVMRPLVLPLWAAWAFSALAYSLRPFRLKERGVLGLAFSFVAQWSLPIMLCFAVLNRFGGWDMAVFVAALTISGATLEIAHQRWDRARDLSTGTGTWGTRTSLAELDRLFCVALFLDEVGWGAILFTFILSWAPVVLSHTVVSPGLPLLLIYAVLFGGAVTERSLGMRRGELLDPYYSDRHSFSKTLHETMPNFVIPVYMMALATAYQPTNGLILLVFLFWRLVLGRADWRWPLRTLKGWWRTIRRVGTEG